VKTEQDSRTYLRWRSVLQRIEIEERRDMALGKPVKYLFLVVYNWHVKTNPSRHPAIVPTVVVTILLCLNILVTIQLLLFVIGDISLLKQFPDLLRILGYVCYLIVGGLVWLSFIRNDAYRRFEREFATTSTARMRRRTVAVYLYVVVSVLGIHACHARRHAGAPSPRDCHLRASLRIGMSNYCPDRVSRSILRLIAHQRRTSRRPDRRVTPESRDTPRAPRHVRRR
jgi:hypothetical protein